MSFSLAGLIGVDATTIGWAVVGGWFGSVFAPRMSAWRTAIQFCAACLISSLVATAAALYMDIDRPIYTHVMAMAISASFYTIKQAFFSRIGSVIDKWLTKVFGPAAEDKP